MQAHLIPDMLIERWVSSAIRRVHATGPPKGGCVHVRVQPKNADRGASLLLKLRTSTEPVMSFSIGMDFLGVIRKVKRPSTWFREPHSPPSAARDRVNVIYTAKTHLSIPERLFLYAIGAPRFVIFDQVALRNGA